MKAANSVADWLTENTEPAFDEWLQIGSKTEIRDNGTIEYKNSHKWAYPNYLIWCSENGRSRPVSVRKFKDTLIDIAETLGIDVTEGHHPTDRWSGVKGLRLISDEFPLYAGVTKGKNAYTKGYREAKEGFDPSDRRDRRGEGSNFGSQRYGQKTEGAQQGGQNAHNGPPNEDANKESKSLPPCSLDDLPTPTLMTDGEMKPLQSAGGVL